MHESLPAPARAVTASWTSGLAAAMLVLGLVNAGLMAWLWRFPMLPDPGSSNPHGRSSAPVAGIWLHRLIGYAFVLCYAALLVEMLPRLGRFAEWSAVSILHAAGGAAILVLLVIKIGIIRVRPSASGALPWLGGALAGVTVLVAVSGVLPNWLLTRPAPLTPMAAAGQQVIQTRCLQCHGASVIAFERERPERWHRELREMQRRAGRSSWALPISDAEREQVAAYLIQTRAKQRGRERDRDRDREQDQERDRGADRD